MKYLSRLKKTIAPILILALPLLISACAEVAAPLTEEERYRQAVEAGYLADAAKDPGHADAPPETAPVEIGDISRTIDFRLFIDMPVYQFMYFKRDDGRLKGVYVEAYDYVKEGDVLAEIVYNTDAMEVERDILLLTIRQFEQSYDSENTRYLQNISKLRSDYYASAEAMERRILGLQLEKLELNYELFVLQSGRSRAEYEEQLAKMEEEVYGESLIAPFDGIVAGISDLEIGSVVRSDVLMLIIIDDSVIQFTVEETAGELRCGDIIEAYRQVTLGSGEVHVDEFLMRVVSDPMVQETRVMDNFGNWAYRKVLYILAPVDMEAFMRWTVDSGISRRELANLTLNARRIVHEAHNAVIVPSGAVYKENEDYYVYIYEDGMSNKRYIATGFIEKSYTQVLYGLEPGQTVVVP